MELIPKHKSDLATATAAVAAGYPAVEPILEDLMVWLQDYNWPVAEILAPFLSTIGRPLIRHIDAVFASDDEIWKYWVVVCLIGKNRQLLEHYRLDLERIGHKPTLIEKRNELDEVARDALDSFGDRQGGQPSGAG
jgi:hypothetical protein